MPIPSIFSVYGTINGPFNATAGGGTAFTGLVKPFPGVPQGPALLQQRFGSGPGANATTLPSSVLTNVASHITKISYTTGATAHKVTIMRPLNFAYFTKAFPKNSTVLDGYLSGDPGKYSTNYLYNNVAPVVADNVIAANDYVVYQLADGTWVTDIITSGTFGSSLTLTTGTPNVTNGFCPAGSPFYFFGIATNSDPATNQVQPSINYASSGTQVVNFALDIGLISALHNDDPMLVYSPNTTNAGILEYVGGFYARV